MDSLPIYYKGLTFVDSLGRSHVGYLEPPFSEDDVPFFYETGSADRKQGIGGIYYNSNDIVSWEYLPEPPEVNYHDVDFNA